MISIDVDALNDGAKRDVVASAVGGTGAHVRPSSRQPGVPGRQTATLRLVQAGATSCAVSGERAGACADWGRDCSHR